MKRFWRISSVVLILVSVVYAIGGDMHMATYLLIAAIAIDR